MSTSEVTARVARIDELVGLGHLQRALRLANSLLAAHGESAELLAVRCQIQANLGYWRDALDGADLAVDRWPQSAGAHAARGDVLHSMERYADALAEADQALALDRTHVVGYQVRALALAELGQPDAAVEAAERALARAPGDPQCEMSMVTALLARDQSEALAYADLLVRQRSDSMALTLRALLHMLAEDWAAANVDALRAITLDPDNAVAFMVIMVADGGTERWDELLVHCEAEPLRGSVIAVQMRAVALMATDRPREAAEALGLVIEQQPRNVAMLSLLCSALLRTSAWTDVVSVSTAILAIEPDDQDTMIARARAWCELGRAAAAIEDMDRLVARESGQLDALSIRSIAYVLVGRYADALADADAAFRAGATADLLAADARILALLALGRRREAEQASRQVLRDRPDDELATTVISMREARNQQRLDNITDLAGLALRVFTGTG